MCVHAVGRMQRYYHFVVPPWELGSFCLCLPSLHLQLIMLHTVALLPQSNYVKITGKLVPDENNLTDTSDKVYISMQKDVCWWGKMIKLAASSHTGIAGMY